MLKFLLIFTFISISFSWKVLFFRSNTLLIVGDIDSKSVTPNDITISNFTFAPGIISKKELWEEVFTIKKNKDKQDAVISLIKTGDWWLDKYPKLGGKIEADFKSDDGDQFDIYFSFSYFQNDFLIPALKELDDFVDSINEKVNTLKGRRI